MGTCHSWSDKIKRDKDHNRQKMFKFGVSFGRNDLNLEGHLQMGYNSKTIKNYGLIEKQVKLPENTTLAKCGGKRTVYRYIGKLIFYNTDTLFICFIKKEDMAQATADEYLKSVYYNPKRSGSFGGVGSLYRDVKQEGKFKLSLKKNFRQANGSRYLHFT